MSQQELESLMQFEHLFNNDGKGTNDDRFDGFGIGSSNLEANQEVIPIFSLNSRENDWAKGDFPNITDLKLPMTSHVAVEECKPWQNNADGLDPTVLQNKLTTVNSLSSVPCPQGVDSSMNDKDLMEIQETLVDPTADISLFNTYLKLNSDGTNLNTFSQEDEEYLVNILDDNQTAIPNLTSKNWENSEDTNLKPTNNSSIAMEEYKPHQNYHNSLNSNDLQNQSPDVNLLNSVPYTQIVESSMIDKDLVRIQGALMDPTADISPFATYLKQSNDGANSNNISQENEEFLFSILGEKQTSVSIPSSTNCENCEDNYQLSQINNINLTNNCYVSTEENEPCRGNIAGMHSTNLPNQIYTVNAQPPAPSTSSMDSLMCSEQMMRIEEIAVQNDNKIEPMTHQDIEDLFSIIKDDQTASPNQSNTCIDNVEDKCHVPQKNDLRQSMKTNVAEKESKPCQNNAGGFLSSNLPYQVSVGNTTLCVQVTGQYAMQIKESNPGPMRNKVGRCARGEIPLYLLPEPKDKQERRRWLRAKTAYEHRMSKKSALVNTANKTEELIKEMNELKNQLQIVSAQRDAYKNTLDNLHIKIQKLEKTE
ncbi:unnamed protein product [Meganyctiphanes norvegica]|uniref:BZIP domain-containing protein n=1 Tax=Meganyctiphanes norvegica TaxID=48144 RepID=A0AAV2QYB4_MEGNR